MANRKAKAKLKTNAKTSARASSATKRTIVSADQLPRVVPVHEAERAAFVLHANCAGKDASFEEMVEGHNLSPQTNAFLRIGGEAYGQAPEYPDYPQERQVPFD